MRRVNRQIGAPGAGRRNIGEAAQASGVSAKMIRHYESIGLIPKADRTVAGYRLYSDNEVHVLRFIKRARSLGFSTARVAALLGLWQDRGRASREVKRVALEHVAELDAQIRDMEGMKHALEHLAYHCRGDERPECPILDDLVLAADRVGPGHSTKSAARSKKAPRSRRVRQEP